MELTNPSTLRNILEAYGFSFSKGLGQNFLIDDGVLSDIIEGSGINTDCGALEIGPGAGTLTRALCENSKKTVAVEIDNRLIPLLGYTLADFKNVTVINADILKLNLKELIEREFGSLSVHVVANLPYYITTPIIMSFLENDIGVKSLTVMVQKEVAERMVADPGSKDYGALTAAVKFYTEPKIICRAEPHCFMPQPKVASVVVNLKVLDKPSVSVNNREFFFKVIRSAFVQRRKTLANALSHSPFVSLDKENVLKCIDKAGLSSDVRGERLSLEQFALLSNLLSRES